MSHKSEIKKRKYRNWVRGGLAYKYLKQGLEGFADDVVKQEHRRILSSISYTPGISCTRCIIGNLKPTHTCIINSAGKNECYWGQRKCNCLRTKKEKCRLHICDKIMEEVLESHASTPPTPNWANTDMQKWCTEPWEVAKCFINAPGYLDKTKAADIDISGLLHVFINNINLHSHLACSMSGNNIFLKVRDRRNKLYHSASMEMEDGELTECIDDIVKILEDSKELKGNNGAQQAGSNLKQLKESNFIITTNNEVDACKEAISYVSQKSEELKQVIEVGKKEIQFAVDQGTARAKGNIQTCQNDAIKEFDKHSEGIYERVNKMETNLPLQMEKIKADVSEEVGNLGTAVFERVEKLESDVSVLKSDVSSVKEQVTSLEKKLEELNNERHIYEERLDYVEEKKELRGKLVEYYRKHLVNTSLTPLNQKKDSINVKDIYVPPEIKVILEDQTLYKRATTEENNIKGYHEIFETEGQRHKQIYILGEVGTGKTTFCKMMVENWCTYHLINDATKGSTFNKNDHERADNNSTVTDRTQERYDDVSQMEQYEFLFFIPMQCMSAFKTDIVVDMIKELTKLSNSYEELIDRIFQEDSERCLIIADSLDEWRPCEEIVRKPHVSYGIPNRDQARDATVITLSRPSARGILNLKNSEVDFKLQLLGVSSQSLKSFIKLYISKTKVNGKTYDDFSRIMIEKQIDHVEKTPLLLQQLLWLYINNMDLGESVCETYCLVLNTMLAWSGHKQENQKMLNIYEHQSDATECMKFRLPNKLKRYPRFEGKERVLYLCGETAFEALTSPLGLNVFGRRNLLKIGLSEGDITELTQFGILSESNRFDLTEEDTQYAFIHMSYLEFFAALYVTMYINMNENDKKPKILDKLFCNCKSAGDVFQFLNMIKLVCGLFPALIRDLSQRVSRIFNNDEDILSLRRDDCREWHSSTFFWIWTMRYEYFLQLQNLMLDFLKECDSDKSVISLSDVYMIGELDECLSLERINPDDVISLNFSSMDIGIGFEEDKIIRKVIKKLMKFTEQYKQVQYMHIRIGEVGNFPFLFSEKVHLKKLTLEFFDNYDIDLTMLNQLQIFQLYACQSISISGLNTKQLERLEIIDCRITLSRNCLLNVSRLTVLCIGRVYGLFESLVSTIQHAPLTTLQISQCKLCNAHPVNYIDLSRHNHLEYLILSESPGLAITGLNTEQLQTIYIDYVLPFLGKRDFYYTMYDIQVIQALKFTNFPQASPLEELYLEGLVVDITSLNALIRQAQLQVLSMRKVCGVKSVYEGQFRAGSVDQSVDKGKIKAVPDNQSVYECHIKAVSDGQSVDQGYMKAVPDDQSVDEVHIKDLSDNQSEDECQIKDISDNQSDDEGHIKDVSDNQSVDQGHIRAVSDDQSVYQGQIKYLSDNQSDDECHIKDISDDQKISLLMKGHNKGEFNEKSDNNGKLTDESKDQSECEGHLTDEYDDQFDDEGQLTDAFDPQYDSEAQLTDESDHQSDGKGQKSGNSDHQSDSEAQLTDESDHQSDSEAQLTDASYMHVIDLSGQTKLTDVTIEYCENIHISNINSAQITSCYIDSQSGPLLS